MICLSEIRKQLRFTRFYIGHLYRYILEMIVKYEIGTPASLTESLSERLIETCVAIMMFDTKVMIEIENEIMLNRM